jgi:tRNA (guanosine-2'-O-)-methyltransferase
MRSAEALGYLNVHVIETAEKFKIANRVTQGAEKWLDVEVWEEPGTCVARLRSQGYRIAATAMTETSQALHEIDFSPPTALFFGNEHEGLSRTVLEAAEVCVAIPMSGFSQSFNISVAAALCLHHVRDDRRRRLGRHGDLPEAQRRRLEAAYYVRSLEHARELLLRARRDGLV